MSERAFCCIWANCQGEGLEHYLRKSAWGAGRDFRAWQNYRVILGEQKASDVLADVRRCGVLIYQPCGPIGELPGSEELAWSVRGRGGIALSFSYQYNGGFWPFFKQSEGMDGWVAGRALKELVRSSRPHDVYLAWNGGLVGGDCALRFALCVAEQARRERVLDVAMSDWILERFQEEPLFVNQNHPTSALFVELTRRILAKMGESAQGVKANGVNDINLCGGMPLHQSVVNELGLKYQADSGSHAYYRASLEKFVGECGLRPAGS